VRPRVVLRGKNEYSTLVLGVFAYKMLGAQVAVWIARLAMPLIPSLDTVELTATDGPLRPSGVLEIKILDPLRIQCGDATLDASTLGGINPRQILEILLLNLGTPVFKDRLIDILWAGRPPAEALPTLGKLRQRPAPAPAALRHAAQWQLHLQRAGHRRRR
jgi:hypothetical protein